MWEQTRRSWFVILGQAAAGASLANMQLTAEITAAERQLPPGVYAPAGDHLGHALMNAEAFHPIPPGCPTDYVRPRSGPFQPRFFTASEFALVRRLTELLLGEVAAGASDDVAEWIDLRVASSRGVRQAEARFQPLHRGLAAAYHGSDQTGDVKQVDSVQICRAGLEWLPSDFLSRENAQQVALLQTISDERPNLHVENAGTRLFDYLKAEIIRGFYTSRAGLRELDFKGNAFYARSPGCALPPRS